MDLAELPVFEIGLLDRYRKACVAGKQFFFNRKKMFEFPFRHFSKSGVKHISFLFRNISKKMLKKYLIYLARFPKMCEKIKHFGRKKLFLPVTYAVS